jgi:hypothetical protein
MKPAAALILAIGAAASGCAPYPSAYPEPTPLLAGPEPEGCILIRREISRQQRVAAYSGVMASALVEASVRLNAANVISGLETRAALAGCRV